MSRPIGRHRKDGSDRDMKELERLIRDLRKQLLPYHHDHDIESGRRRWDVAEEDYLTSWISWHLGMCRERNRCYKRERCAFYDYGDLAKRNYEICYELLLRLENGYIACRFKDEAETDEDKDGSST